MVVKILDIKKVTHDVKRFRFEKPDGFEFTPGQATDVAVNEKGWYDKLRPFTFTSLASDDFLEFTIKGYPLEKYPEHGGVTEKIHSLKVGDELIIDEPWGAIEYKGKGVFIAGGAGVTPFIAIIKNLKAKGETAGNKLIFSNKTKDDIIYEKEFLEWLGKNQVVYTLTREKVGGYENGHIDESFLKNHVESFDKYFYVCGPKEFVSEVKKSLKNLGARADTLVFEK